MTPLYLICALSLVLLIGVYLAETRKRYLRGKSWEELLLGLEPVNTEWLVVIALEYGHPREDLHPLDVFEDDLWESLGSWKGIRAMVANADRLTALAVHAHHWNHERACEISAQIKVEARTLRLAALNAAWKKLIRRPAPCYALDLERLARSYFKVTECLIELYEYRAFHISSAIQNALRPYLRSTLIGKPLERG